MKLPEVDRAGRLMVSRFAETKREAARIANQWKRLGATHRTLTGKRGGPYRVRSRIGLSEFAKFCAREAREQQGK